MSNSTYLREVKKGKSQVFRRVFIKRMMTDGKFESSWLDITSRVKKFGSIKKEVDSIQRNRFRFSSTKLVCENSQGEFNPETNENSLWLGFANRQRTIVKIEAGFVNVSKNEDGIWIRDELPHAQWDVDLWDDVANWDDNPVLFQGIISGDISQSTQNEVTLNIMPTLEVLRQFPARNLTGFDNSITASRFVELVRDQVDANNEYIFQPFFTDWEIQTTTVVYSDLNTSTAEDLIDLNVWDVVERLAEVENFVPLITNEGMFKFVSRDANTTVSSFEFHGLNSSNREFGRTIKSVSGFGPKVSKFYSRVQVQFDKEDTITSYVIEESALEVSGSNLPWVLGHRTYELSNFWIPDTAAALNVAQTIYLDTNALKKEASLVTTFIPSVEVLDKVLVTYDSTPRQTNSLWDIRDWFNDSDNDLYWDSARGDAIRLVDEEFVVISTEINLDSLECKFQVRET